MEGSDMRNEWNIWVVGGDLRQVRLAQLLCEEGHTVHTWALEEAEGVPEPAADLKEAQLADCVVLPLPAAGEDGRLNAPFSGRAPELAEVLDALRPGQVVCAGRASPELTALAEERQLRLFDYFRREELAVANAVPTALAVGHRSDRGRSGKRTADRNSRRPWPHTHERSRSIRIGSRGR